MVEVVSNVSEEFTIDEAMEKSVEKDIVYCGGIGELQDRSKEAGGQVEMVMMQRRISWHFAHRLRVGLV